MSNIAGKSYAMNVVTPMAWYTAWLTRIVFFAASLIKSTTIGLRTLSLIHYARWVVLSPNDFPRLDPRQPKEDLSYDYMFFFSNFNGSWDQYVDSFSSSIPEGLDKFWLFNIKYPKSVPMLPFHKYITANQIWTDHYYNAYPMAASNDVKAAKRVRDALLAFNVNHDPNQFRKDYNNLLLNLQGDLGSMGPNPIVSLSAGSVQRRLEKENGK